MSFRIPTFLATLALAAACASVPPNLNDDMIIPGERIGEIELDMPLATLLAIKGTPRSTTPIKGTEATTYVFDGITVAADDKVYWIIATDPRFRTARGLSPGVEQIFARAAYGKPRCVVTKDVVTAYDYREVYFEVDNTSGKVTQVGILKDAPTCRTAD
jgi:hypothetical protein